MKIIDLYTRMGEQMPLGQPTERNQDISTLENRSKMQIHELKAALEDAGLEMTTFPAEYLEDMPFNEEEITLLSECGLPKISGPGKIYYAQDVHPEEGDHILRKLSDEIPHYRHNATAQQIIVFAKDEAANLMWINTASGHQITLKDDAATENRYVNNSLQSYLQSSLAYARYQKNYDATQSGLDQIQKLRAELEAIDPEAFSDELNFWRNALAMQLD
jgi:SUKH-4 immunity protein